MNKTTLFSYINKIPCPVSLNSYLGKSHKTVGVRVWHSCKKWVKRFLICLGTLFLTMIILFSFLVSKMISPSQMEMPDKMVLRYTLENETSETGHPLSFPFFIANQHNSMPVYEFVASLTRAARDPNVKGLVVQIKGGEYGPVHIQEMRKAVKLFRNSGKFAYVYSPSLGGISSGMGAYYLASAFDKIWVQPMGDVGIYGFIIQTPFIRGLLDKIGIIPDMIHKGDYKTGPEPSMRKTMSPENRTMTTTLLNDMFKIFIDDVSKDRKIPVNTLKSLIDNAPLSAIDAQKSGIIDNVGYSDQFIDYVHEKAGEKTPWVDLEIYSAADNTDYDDNSLAVVHINGVILPPSSGNWDTDETVNIDAIVSSLAMAADDDNIKAIIVRINSPGGDPVSSETLRRAIVKASEKKPLIVSMGNVAASGGYWIAVNARHIVLEPMTLTGSIGVYGGKYAASPLLDKMGINIESIAIGANADIAGLTSPYNNRERVRINQMLDDVYETFIHRVATGRGIKPETVRKLAGGRVYTGYRAVDAGLADSIGGLDTAILFAKGYAKIPVNSSVKIHHYPQAPSPLDEIMSFFNQNGLVRLKSFLTDTTKIRTQTDNLLNDIRF